MDFDATLPSWMYSLWLSGTPSARQSSEPQPTIGRRSTTAKRSVAAMEKAPLIANEPTDGAQEYPGTGELR